MIGTVRTLLRTLWHMLKFWLKLRLGLVSIGHHPRGRTPTPAGVSLSTPYTLVERIFTIVFALGTYCTYSVDRSLEILVHIFVLVFLTLTYI